MEDTIKQIFLDSRTALTLRQIYWLFAQRYNLSEHQKEDHPKYHQPNFYHEIRSIIAKLVNERFLEQVERATYQLK